MWSIYRIVTLLPSVHQFAIAPIREQIRMTTWPQSCRLCFSWMTIVRLLSIVVSSGRQLVNSWQIFTLVWSWFSHFWRPGRGPGWDCWRSPTQCAATSREAAPARGSASSETWHIHGDLGIEGCKKLTLQHLDILLYLFGFWGWLNPCLKSISMDNL